MNGRAKGLGFAFPPLQERLERLEETLQIAAHMWRGDTTPLEGRYYRLAEPINSPKPVSHPHPPILIGGSGEKKILRLVAEYADACNFPVGGASQAPLRIKELPSVFAEGYGNRREFIRRKLDVLRKHCRDVGRSYDDIEKTVITSVRLAPNAQDVDYVVNLCKELAGSGIQHVIFNIANVHEIDPLRTIGREVIPRVAATT